MHAILRAFAASRQVEVPRHLSQRLRDHTAAVCGSPVEWLSRVTVPLAETAPGPRAVLDSLLCPACLAAEDPAAGVSTYTLLRAEALARPLVPRA